MPLDPSELDRMVGYSAGPSPIPPRCPECGYNLTGAVRNRCPECGRPFRLREIRKQTEDARGRIGQAEGLNDLVQAGFRVAIVGIALLLLGVALGGRSGSATSLGRLCGFVCGITALALGLSVVRYRRLPKALREDVRNPPNPWLALAGICLGLLLVVVCVVPW